MRSNVLCFLLTCQHDGRRNSILSNMRQPFQAGDTNTLSVYLYYSNELDLTLIQIEGNYSRFISNVILVDKNGPVHT